MSNGAHADADAPVRPLRIAIIGGGIVGLTLAVALHKLQPLSPTQVQFTLYESAAKFSEIGAGIMMGQNALQVFDALGLLGEYETLARTSWMHAGDDDEGSADEKGGVFFQYRFGDGRLGGEPFYTLKMPGGQMNSHRAELLELLLAHLPYDRVRFRKQLVSYEQADSGAGLRLQFADGSEDEADVLLGADGIKSTVRRLMYARTGDGNAEEQDPRWSGTYVYRALVPTHLVLGAVGRRVTSTPMMWLEQGRHLVHYPVAGDRYINVVAMRSDYSRGRCPKWEKSDWVEHKIDEREMMRDYEGCGKEVKAILELVERPSRWALFDLPDLPYFVQGNVALLGDAAHAMTPHLGNGASQGIEDAHLLAHLLLHPLVTPSTVSSALKAYELVRKARVQGIKELSYETGRLWELSSSKVAANDTREFARVARETVEYIWAVDVGKQVETAKGWFEMSLQ